MCRDQLAKNVPADADKFAGGAVELKEIPTVVEQLDTGSHDGVGKKADVLLPVPAPPNKYLSAVLIVLVVHANPFSLPMTKLMIPLISLSCYHFSMVKLTRDTPMKNQGQKPRSAAIGTPVMVRLQPEQLKAIDTLRREQENLPSRPEMIRRLVERDLRTEAVRKGTK